MRVLRDTLVTVLALIITTTGTTAAAARGEVATEAAVWGPVERAVAVSRPFGTAGELATGPHAVVDDTGAVTVVGVRSVGDRRYVVRAVRRSPGGVWAEPVAVARGEGYATETRVAADARGRVLLGWVAGRTVRVADFAAGAGWSRATQVGAARPRGIIGNLGLAVNTAGAALLTWDVRPADLPDVQFANQVFAAHRTEAGTWGRVVRLSQPGRMALRPYPVVNRRGALFVAWTEYLVDFPDGRAMLSVRRPGRPSWRRPAVLSSTGAFVHGATAVPKGGVAVAWTRARGRTHRLVGMRVVPGHERQQRLLSRRDTIANWPDVSSDSHGNVTAAWLTRRGEVEVRDWRAGGRLTPIRTVADGPASWWGLQVHGNAAGDAVLCWSSWAYGDRPMRVSYRPSGTAWTVPLRMSTKGDGNASCAVGPTGRAAAVWRGSRGGVFGRILDR